MVSRRAILSAAGVSAVSLAIPASAKEDNEANKATALRFINEVLTGGNVGILDEIIAETYESPNPDDAPGRDALKSRIDNDIQYQSYSIEGAVYTTDDIAIKSPNVFVRGYVQGANTQGKKIDAVYFAEFKFEGGLIVTHWLLKDEIALMGI